MARSIRTSTVHPICVRQLEVRSVEDLGPGMRRVVLGGPGLAAHTRDGVEVPPMVSTGFDDDIKLLLPDPVSGANPVPRQLDDGRLEWSEETIGLARTYTVRGVDAAAGELVVDVALHGVGLASTWARRTRPGQQVHVAGPKMSKALPEGVDWLLLAGDETALPAIARCLDELDSSVRVRVLVEVADSAHRIPLDTAARAEVTWVDRSAGDCLADAVRRVSWWEGTPFAWVAGEALAIAPIRRWLRDDRGVPRTHAEVTGYWRRREVRSTEGDPETVDVAATGPRAAARVHELTELATPIAVRAACELELFALIHEGATRASDLAERTAVPAERLSSLLGLLVAAGFLRSSAPGSASDSAPGSGPVTYALTELGAELSDPEGHLTRELSGAAARRDLALTGLVDALRSGGPARLGPDGRTWDAQLAAEPDLAASDDDDAATRASFTAPALPGVLSLRPGERIAILGPGAAEYAGALAQAQPGVEVQCPRMPARGARVEWTADTVVAVDLVGTTPAGELPERMRALLEAAARVVVVTDLLPTDREADDHDLEEDLRRLCLYGAGLPTEAGLHAVAAAAGAEMAELRAVGWGQRAVTFVRAGEG